MQDRRNAVRTKETVRAANEYDKCFMLKEFLYSPVSFSFCAVLSKKPAPQSPQHQG